MVKPHIEAIFMAREFSEFSTEYSTKKSDFSDIRNNLDAIMHIRTEVERCEQELGALRTQKSNLVLFSAFLTEDERNAQTASIDTQITAIENQLRTLKTNTLYKTKEEIQTASQTLDKYIDDLNTNFDFKKSLRDEIKTQSQNRLLGLEQEKTAPTMELALYSKIEALAENDSKLKSYLSIDDDKAVLALLESYVNKYSHVKPGTRGRESDQAKKEREAKLKVFKDEVATIQRRITSKGNSFKKYITDHKTELGLPADMTIDFNDDTSILHNIALYTDPKSNASFSDIKTKASDSIKSKDAQIEALQSYIRYADEDLTQIRRDREAELEEKKTYKGQGLLSKAKRFFKGLGKGLSNWVHDKPKPFKGVFKRPDDTRTLTQAKVIDTTNNFADAYRTEIGQDAYAKVIKEYNERIQNEQQQSHPQGER